MMTKTTIKAAAKAHVSGAMKKQSIIKDRSKHQKEKMIKVNRSHKSTTRLCRLISYLKKRPPMEEKDAALRQFQHKPNTKWRTYLLLPVRSGCLQEIKSPGMP
jgi:hypothetical protein